MKTCLLYAAILFSPLPSAAICPPAAPPATATNNNHEALAQELLQNQLQFLALIQHITDATSAQATITSIEKNHATALRLLHNVLCHKESHMILARTEELLKPHAPAMEAELLRLKNAHYYGNTKLRALITEGAL